MAATLLPDIIDGAVLDNGSDFVRVVRSFHVKDVDVKADGFDPLILVKSLQTGGMPQLNDLHPVGNPYLRVVRQIVRGTANNQCRVEVIYETPQFGGGVVTPGGAFVLNDSTSLVSERVQLGPGGDPLVVKIGGGLLGDLAFAPAQQLTMDRLTPMRVIGLTGSVQATTQQMDNCRASIGRVNGQTWAGLGRGFWLCSQFDSETFDLGESYQVRAQFMTRQYRDWKSYGFWQNAVGELEQETVDASGQTQAMMSAGYAFAQTHSTHGFMTVGLYDFADFGAIFGNF
jgi:hypothetical protein